MAAMQNLLSIGVFSDSSHLSVKTLRRYHELGLLVPAAVDERSGYRGYAVAQLTDAQIIRRLRELDVPLDDVATILHERDPVVTARVLGEHRGRMKQRLDETERIVNDLQEILDEPHHLHRVLVHERRQRAEPLVSMAHRGPVTELPTFLGHAYARLEAHVRRAGRVPVGPRGAWYGDGEGIDHDDLSVVAWVTTDGPLRGDTGAGIAAGELPASALAVALHVGPYDDMTDTYGSIGVWVAEHGRRVLGPLQELYLVGPDTAPDPSTWRTEVGWPVDEPA
jgi:DNA-binding transcriptional MerR regulator/effector-binding domain-containing protein